MFDDIFKTAAVPAPDPATYLRYDDYPARRQQIFDKVQAAVQAYFPIANEKFTIKLDNLQYAPTAFTRTDYKDAILYRKNLSQKLKGDLIAVDNATNQVISKTRSKNLMDVPYLTDHGTFIRNGAEYTIPSQLRLMPAVYSRITVDGSPEAHFNVRPESGTGFRIFMEPDSAIFYIRHRGRKLPLMPVLKAMDVPDEDMQKAWGKQIYQANAAARTPSHTVKWLADLTGPGDVGETQQDDGKTPIPESDSLREAQDFLKTGADPVPNTIREHFEKMQIDPEATRLTLGTAYDHVTPSVMLDSTNKLIKLSRHEVDPDNRDSLEFQTVHDVSDFISDKIRLDQNATFRKYLWKLTGRQGNLDGMPPGIFTKHADNLFTVSGLAQNIEEISPQDIYDQNQRIVRLGEGAMSSIDVAPDESRSVQASYAGFVDPVRSPSSIRVGLDNFLAKDLRKGPDNLLYKQFLDPATGKPIWMNTRQAAASAIGFPEFVNTTEKFIPVIYKAKDIRYIDRREVNAFIPSGDSMFSAGSDTVPMKAGVKGMRLVMGASYPRQALPLVERDAPYVMTAMDDGSPVHKYLGKYAGATSSDVDGVVTKVTPDFIELQTVDGQKTKVALFNSYPFSRKTSITNIPTVKAGDQVKKGDLLAGSNFTDQKGLFAPGKNISVAYMNYKGWNYEDAIVISESAAKKLSAETMYNTKYDLQEGISNSKQKFSVLYPGRWKTEKLKTIDDDGVVKKGTVLYQGDPMVLAVQERMPSTSTLGRRTVNDISETWEHSFPGVVTDVAKSKGGYSVFVKSQVPVSIGDKLAIAHGGKGVVGRIITDGEMPHGEDGKPLDMILSPLSISSRTNPAQLIIAALGKITAKTGRRYILPGFNSTAAPLIKKAAANGMQPMMDTGDVITGPSHDTGGMTQFAMSELAKNGMKDTETIFDPQSGRKIPGIFVGNTYTYRLQQTAESKSKSRSTGFYTLDQDPGRGGPEGCFPGYQTVMTLNGEQRISHIVEKRLREFVWSYNDMTATWGFYPVTDWFTYRSSPEQMLCIEIEGAAAMCGGKRTKHTSCMYPTVNHQIYRFDGSKVLAGELKVGDDLQTWGPVPTEDQKQLLLGTMLGDAYLAHNAVQIMHSVKQGCYLEFKQKVLSGLGATMNLCIDSEGVAPNGRAHRRCLLTLSNYSIARWMREFCFQDGKKTVTNAWLNQLTDLGLAIWILDDGSISNHAKKVSQISMQGDLATQGFTKEGTELCVNWLNTKLGTTSICSRDLGKYSKVYLSADACRALVKIIAREIPYTAIPESKKFLKALVQQEQLLVAPRTLQLQCVFDKRPAVVKNIRAYVHPKGVQELPVYDICVEGTHKYTVASVSVSNSKHIGDMELHSLLAHGALDVIRDDKVIKGQKNTDFWRQLKTGRTPSLPGNPFVYDKFKALIQAAGVNLSENDNHMNIFGMTDKQAMDTTGNREIKTAKTYTPDLKPIPGGLFDPEATGSAGDGRLFGYITLPEKMLNPVMKNSVRVLLGLSNKQLDEVIAGRQDHGGLTGGPALEAMLKNVDLDRTIETARQTLQTGSASKRDAALKQLGYASAMKKNGVRPEDFMMSRVPVLPPVFRPITVNGGMIMANDVNYLYKTLIESIQDYTDSKVLPKENQDQAREQLYKSYQAVVGTADPIKAEQQQKNIGGILQGLFGKGSAKLSFVNRKMIGTNIDLAGLGVFTPDPGLRLDQVGLPEDKAWEMYTPFVIRDMVMKGIPATIAAKSVELKDRTALASLQKVVRERPVMVNRAPTLHKYSTMAFWPVLMHGETVRLNPSIVAPYNADSDGDVLSYTIPVSADAVRNAVEKMLPQRNLVSVRNDKVQYVPRQEYLHGLYFASKAPAARPVKRFASEEQVLAAYKRGELAVDDPVTVG